MRFGTLINTVTTVFQTKLDSNPENTIGVMTRANKWCVRPHSITNPISFNPYPS